MKKSIICILILLIIVQFSYEIKVKQVTSLDPLTVKSPGNFLNVAPDATEIISPNYSDDKLSVHMLTTKTKKDCDGKERKFIERKNVSYSLNKGEIIKSDESKELFGISSIKVDKPKADTDKVATDPASDKQAAAAAPAAAAAVADPQNANPPSGNNQTK